MLASEKIAKAFEAIVEEAEKAIKKTEDKKVSKRLKTIISIAKHQSDIRNVSKSCCPAHHKGSCK